MAKRVFRHLTYPRAHPATRHKLFVGLLAGCVVFACLLLVLEIAARLVVHAWSIPTRFEPRPFQGFGQTDPVLWWKLQPNLDVRMHGVPLKTNRYGFRDPRDTPPANAYRVYCLGDSTTFGWRLEPARMYTAVAEGLLKECTGREVAVVSTGVPGYTSYQCIEQLREQVGPLQPDCVVVMVGNNECRARSVSDRERGALLARKRALERWLGFSRLWLLLSRTPEALSRTWDKNPSPGRVANTPAEYRENVRELIRTARRMRSKIVVMNVPLRLRFAPTWRHFDRPSPQVARLLRQAEETISRDAPADQQEAILGEALRLQPKQFAAHWLLARLQLRGGRAAEAGRHFALAREHDLHPEAAKPSYNRALAEVCAEEGVPLIDIDRLFAESGQADDTLFLDHCHPSAAGDRIIGTALAHALSGLIP